MTSEISRRAFLGGSAGPVEDAAMRPPGADPKTFLTLCHDCDACHAVCPERVIAVDADSRPRLDLTSGVCTFCGACAEACPTGALQADRITDWPWRARIEDSCLSLKGVSCRSCQDACEENAIRFRLQTGGRAEPVLDTGRCTGCGACSTVCPVRAIGYARHVETPQRALA